MNPIDAMKQALEALDTFGLHNSEELCPVCEVMTNLRTAIEQMEKAEPDGWIDGEGTPYDQHGWGKKPPAGWTTSEENSYPVYRHPAPAAPEYKP